MPSRTETVGGQALRDRNNATIVLQICEKFAQKAVESTRKRPECDRGTIM